MMRSLHIIVLVSLLAQIYGEVKLGHGNLDIPDWWGRGLVGTDSELFVIVGAPLNDEASSTNAVALAHRPLTVQIAYHRQTGVKDETKRVVLDVNTAMAPEEVKEAMLVHCGDDVAFGDELTRSAVLRIASVRWLIARNTRGLEHSFEPPFFEHHHDDTGTSTLLVLNHYLCGVGGRPKLLDFDAPLLALEIGSFEGSSATWFAEHLLKHPKSVLLCLDAWSAEHYDGGGDTNTMRLNFALEDAEATKLTRGLQLSLSEEEEEEPQHEAGGVGVEPNSTTATVTDRSSNNNSDSFLRSKAMKRFADNLGKTPGGGQVLGVRCTDSAISLAGLVSRQPKKKAAAVSLPTAAAGSGVGGGGGSFGSGDGDGSKLDKVNDDDDAAAAVAEWGRFFDLIFIDGGHGADAVLVDALLAFRLLRPQGGVLVFDDYGGDSAETKAGIDAFLMANGENLEVVYQGFIVIAVKT